MAELELIKELCMQWLPQVHVDVLTGLLDEYRVPIPEAKVGKKSTLLTLIMVYLTSEAVEESADGGKALFQKLHNELADYFEQQRTDVGRSNLPLNMVSNPDDQNVDPSSFDKPDVSVDCDPLLNDHFMHKGFAGGTHVNTQQLRQGLDGRRMDDRRFRPWEYGATHDKPLGQDCFDTRKPPFGREGGRVVMDRLREFKISGTIGPVDQKDVLSYTSLMFQIEKGKKARYSFDEILLGVIQAMKPKNNLRRMLESKIDVSERTFLQALRFHYNEKDSTALLQEMANSIQDTHESELDFIFRMMYLRENVIKYSLQETHPFEERFVYGRFFHAVSTGLKNSNIRLQLRKTLTKGLISDEELMQEVSALTTFESEHADKFAKITPAMNSTQIQGIKGGKSDKVSEKPVDESEGSVMLAEIRKLTEKVNQLSSVRDEVRNLRDRFDRSPANIQPLSPAAPVFHRNALPPGAEGGIRPQANRHPVKRRSFRCRSCENHNITFCNHCFLKN